jgi:hypothetical protein
MRRRKHLAVSIGPPAGGVAPMAVWHPPAGASAIGVPGWPLAAVRVHREGSKGIDAAPVVRVRVRQRTSRRPSGVDRQGRAPFTLVQRKRRDDQTGPQTKRVFDGRRADAVRMGQAWLDFSLP